MEMLNYHDVSPGGSMHVLGDRTGQMGKEIGPVLKQPVLAYRIDDLIERLSIPVPSHIKIDVDGTEFAVLKGADRIVASPKVKSVLLKLEEEQPETDEVIRFLASRGVVIQSKLKHAYGGKSGPSSKVHNYVFHRPETCTCPTCSGQARNGAA